MGESRKGVTYHHWLSKILEEGVSWGRREIVLCRGFYIFTIKVREVEYTQLVLAAKCITGNRKRVLPLTGVVNPSHSKTTTFCLSRITQKTLDQVFGLASVSTHTLYSPSRLLLLGPTFNPIFLLECVAQSAWNNIYFELPLLRLPYCVIIILCSCKFIIICDIIMKWKKLRF